jgi:hypothetical protein
MSRKPALFVGSSVEGLEVAHSVQEILEFDCEAAVWTQGVFQPSRMTLADLYVRTRRTDLALFVFTPDDVAVIRGKTTAVPRDNVIFELGLFLGALEPDRCFILQPRGADLHLPTDLLGVTPLTYSTDRHDRNLLAALGPACNQLRRAFRRFEQDSTVLKFAEDRRAKPAVDVRTTTLADYQAEWEGSLKPVREALGSVSLDDETLAEKRPQMRRLFGFLEGLAEAVLSGDLDEAEARNSFAIPVMHSWPHLATLLAPPNHVEDYWNPPPRLAELYLRWRDFE